MARDQSTLKKTIGGDGLMGRWRYRAGYSYLADIPRLARECSDMTLAGLGPGPIGEPTQETGR